MDNIRTLTENALLELGGNPTNQGFLYIVDALEIIESDIEKQYHLMELYADIARKYRTKALIVERCIRYQKDEILYSCNSKILEQYFCSTRQKFSNGKFISTLYLRIDQQKRREKQNAD